MEWGIKQKTVDWQMAIELGHVFLFVTYYCCGHCYFIPESVLILQIPLQVAKMQYQVGRTI